MRPQRPGRRGRGGLPALLARGLLCLCALAVASILAAPAAQAHASLVSTDPAEGAVLPEAPERLTLTFDEPVSVVSSGTRLFAADGSEVATEARSVDEVVTVTPEAALGEGTFVLTYRVISADSHPVTGSLSFSVGTASATVEAPGAVDASGQGLTVVHGAVQGLTYLALVLAAGLAVFLVVLLPDEAVLDGVRGLLTRLLRGAAVVAGAGALVLVPTGAAYQQGLGLGGLLSGAAWSGSGTAEAFLVLVLVAGLGLATAVLRSRAPSTRQAGLALLGAGLALTAPALVGHTRAFGPPLLVLGADVAHLVAAAVWFGGLVGLAVTLPALAKRERLAAWTLARFSTLAGTLLAVVAVAGLLLGWRILGSWSALVTTTYGLVLLSKTVLVSLVVLVAAWNRYRLLPAVLDSSGHQPRVAAATRLRSAVRLEAVGLVAVLLVTGFLVNQPPLEEETDDVTAAERSTVTAVADDARVVAHLSPGSVGSNTLTVQVQTPDGEPLEPVADPVVSVQSDELDLGSRPVRNVDSGTYTSKVLIPTAGRWTVQVSVRTDEFTNPVLSLRADVGG